MHKAKVTLEKVFRGEQETKFGMRNKVGVKVRETDVILEDGSSAKVEDKYLTALFKVEEDNGTEDWEEGKEVEVTITEKNGYFNFKPMGNSALDRIKRLEEKVFGETEETKVVATDDINLDDLEL